MYFDIHKNPSTPGHKYWWAGRGGNHEVTCVSEVLSSKQACIDAIRVVKREAPTGLVYDETGETTGSTDAKRIRV